MADSTRVSVLKNIRTTLRTMTTGGGYNYSVSSGSVTLDPTKNLLIQPDGDGPHYQIEPVPEGQIEYEPADQLVHSFRVNITARHTSDPSDVDSRMQTWENLVQDVETVMAKDITRGDLVTDSRLIAEPEPFVGVGTNVVIVVIPYLMKIYRTHGSP